MKIKLFTILMIVAVALNAANPKYIFLFIGDGMSTPQRMLADEFAQKSGHGHLTMNTLFFSGTTRTSSSSSLVTDSAAAATAIACGEKTKNGRLGLSADGKRRLESCAEVAHRNGKKVGIVTSITINHATPAGFYAHRKSRAELYRIGLDLVDSNFEYFGGGGFAKKHNDTKDSEYKGDIFELAAKAGYTICRDKKSFQALPKKVDKLLAVMGDDGLPYAIDGQDSTPTLADFTRKGIEILDNPKGFFFMIEGGEIDPHGHSNDAASNLREVLALDDAVRVAMEFYEKHKDETLVIVTGDHETGGMSMGFAGTGYNLYMERLVNQKCSIPAFSAIMKKLRAENPNLTFEDTKPVLTKYFNFAFEGDVKKNPMVVTKSELAKLQEGFKNKKLATEARLLISAKAGIGWTSGAHTALPVLTTSQGVGAERFMGFFENTDIAVRIKEMLNR